MESTESTAPIETTEVDSGVAATGGEEAASSPEIVGKPVTPEEKAKNQERINKLTEKERLSSERAYRAEIRAQELEAKLAAQDQEKAQQQAVAPSEDYPGLYDDGIDGDEAKHKAAVASWVRSQTTHSVKSELARERETVEAQKLSNEWSRREADFIKVKPDYSEKVYREPRDGGPVVTPHMEKVMMAYENGPEIAYYLAENQAKSLEIARMPPHLQSAEIGTIRARLEAAKAAPPPVSKAPPPVAKIDGNEATDDDKPNSSWSDARFEKWRQKQIAQR